MCSLGWTLTRDLRTCHKHFEKGTILNGQCFGGLHRRISSLKSPWAVSLRFCLNKYISKEESEGYENQSNYEPLGKQRSYKYNYSIHRMTQLDIIVI